MRCLQAVHPPDHVETEHIEQAADTLRDLLAVVQVVLSSPDCKNSPGRPLPGDQRVLVVLVSRPARSAWPG